MEFKICRVCLDRSATISVFNKQDEVQYCTKIMKCVNVEIAEGDGFPDAICEGCAADLAVSYEFAARCEASDKALRCLDLLQTEPEPQAEPIKQEVKPECNDMPAGQNDAMSSDQNDDLYDSSSFLDDKPLSECHYDNRFENEKPENYSNGNHFGPYQYSKKLLPKHLRTRKLRLKTGPIQCMNCDRMLPCHSALELHMRTHTKERPYSCDLCKKTFSNKYTMKIHIQRHYGIKDDSSKNKNAKDSDKKKKPLQCATCGRMLSSQSAMENHMRTHTGEKPFACERCGVKYKLKGTLKRHMVCSHPELHPDTNFTCEHCGKIFRAKSNIITHMRVHTGEKPYLCPYCSQRFRQVSSLNRHKRRHTGEKPYKCSICGRPFLDRSLLNKHQSVHSNERKFNCNICGKSFKTKCTLKVHLDGHSKTKLWICSFCGMTFTFKGNLRIHIERKHSERSGTCLVCKKEFGDVEAHMRVHTGEKPFICKICDQSYASVRSLSHHMGFKHRDSGKYKCALEDCPKSFPTAAMLEFHVLKHHTQTTPYVCQHCSRGFLRPCDLSRHLKLNHMDMQTQVKSKFLKAGLKDP